MRDAIGAGEIGEGEGEEEGEGVEGEEEEEESPKMIGEMEIPGVFWVFLERM